MHATIAPRAAEQSATAPAGTELIELVFADNHGVLRGKRIPVAQWPRVAREGIAVSQAALIWGVRCEVRDTSPAGGMSDGYPDLKLLPRVDDLRPLPWEGGVAQVLCDVLTMEGEPSPLSARNALAAVVGQAAAGGMEIKAGLEMEFYLLDRHTQRPRGTEVNCYGIADPNGYGEAISHIQRSLIRYGIPVEACNYEYAPGQFEINLRYEGALDACDTAVLLRGAVKTVASRYGLVATFMAKPFDELAGSGLHVHQSLWKDGVNIFSAGNESLSDIGRHYLGGLQKRIGELTLLGSPSLNDYKRRRLNSFCPTRATWGYDNRTLALRVITAGDSVRIEQRDASAACNPYLALAGQISAGLDGVEHGLVPTAPCEGDSYTDTSSSLLPTDVPTAIDLLSASSFAREALGALLIDTHIDTARWEHHEIADRVSQLERDRYIGVV